MKYEIQCYYKITHSWEFVCSFKDLSLAENTYNFFVKKFGTDIIRLICVLDFEECKSE